MLWSGFSDWSHSATAATSLAVMELSRSRLMKTETWGSRVVRNLHSGLTENPRIGPKMKIN